jgi:hypothetical protein
MGVAVTSALAADIAGAARDGNMMHEFATNRYILSA